MSPARDSMTCQIMDMSKHGCSPFKSMSNEKLEMSNCGSGAQFI